MEQSKYHCPKCGNTKAEADGYSHNRERLLQVFQCSEQKIYSDNLHEMPIQRVLQRHSQ